MQLDFSLSQVRLEQSAAHSVHVRALELFINNRNDPDNYPTVQFDSEDLWRFWERLRNLAGSIPADRDELLPPGLTSGNVKFQSVEESVLAAEAMLDTFSTVLQEPLIEEYEGDFKTVFLCGVLRGDVELVVFASANEWNDVRKIRDMRIWRLGYQRKFAMGYVDKGDEFNVGDKWPFGPVKDVRVGDLVFAPTNPADPNYIPTTYLGPLAALLPENYDPGDPNRPPTFNLGDGNRLASIHVRWARKVSASLQALQELITKEESGELIEVADLQKVPLLYLPAERVSFTYWETDSRGNPTVPHTPSEWVAAGKPDSWEPHGVPRNDWALWANWRFVMAAMHLIPAQIHKKLEQEAERLGINITIPDRYDGTDPATNFFDHERVGKQIKARLDEVVMPLFDGGQFDNLRKEIVKFFGPLPNIRHERDEATDLMEDYLWWADRLALSEVIWLTADGRNRRANDGDVKGLLGGGWGTYPTERMATRHPELLFGRPYYEGREGDQYSPFTFEGQQRARAMLLFIPYDANLIIDMIKGVVEQVEFGIQPTIDDVYKQIMSLLGGRRMYARRVINVLNYMEEKFKGKLVAAGTAFEGVRFGREQFLNAKVAATAFAVIRETLSKFFVDGEWDQEAWSKTVSADVDRFGLNVMRQMLGELSGDEDGWVNAVDGGSYIKKVRATLPGVA